MLTTIKKLLGARAPIVLQLSSTECGIASLAMLFAYYGTHVSIDELRMQCGATRDGSSIATLIKVANQNGFQAEAYSVDIDTIKQLSDPVIAYWRFNHFIIINHIKGNRVSINDPAYGSMSINIDEFDRSFTGIIVNLSPTKQTKNTRNLFSPKKSHASWFKSSYPELTFLLICLLSLTFATYIDSKIYNFFIDQFVIGKDTDNLSFVLSLSFIVTSILFFTNQLYKKTELKINIKYSLERTSKIISHTLKLPLIFYILRQRSEIIFNLTMADSIISLFCKNTVSILSGALITIICLALMLKMDFTLTGIIITTNILYLIATLILSIKLQNLEKGYLNAQGKLHIQTISCINNIETVKSCSLEERQYEQWKNLFKKKLAAQDKGNLIKSINSALLHSYPISLLLIVLFIGSNHIIDNKMTIGNLMGFYLLTLFFSSTTTATLKSIGDKKNIIIKEAKISDILSFEPDRRYNNPSDSSSLVSEEIIHCNNLTFNYNSHTFPTLENINLKIRRNEHIAFIGKTGSGKSTFAKLLCSLYQPSSGNIIVFNKELSLYSQDSLRKLFAYVSQENILFSDSIYHNLTLWQKNIPIEKVNQALEIACLTEFIAARGLGSLIEEHGRNLSGGEIQRLEIARALIQDTPILILDEATSAIDYATEKAIIRNLRSLNKTIIFVAHRLQTIKHCDQIITLDAGKITKHEHH